MKNLILLVVALISFSAHAKMMDYAEFIKLSDTQKVDVLMAYKKFLSQQVMPLGEEKKVSIILNFIHEATAAVNDDCFYAGWPSKVRAAGGRQFCTSPANGTNPDYAAQASACSGAQMLCNPVLFGTVGCISAGTQAQKNMAFATCDQKFKSSGQTLAQVAAGLSDPAKRSSAEAMFATAAQVCGSGGFQAAKPMCRNLSAKVAAVRAAMPAIVAAPLQNTGGAQAGANTAGGTQAGANTAGDEVVRINTSGGGHEGAHTPGRGPIGLKESLQVLERPEDLHPGHEECEVEAHAHDRERVNVDLGRPAVIAPLTRVRCAPAAVDGIPETLPELLAEIESNGGEIVQTPVAPENIPHLRSFVAEMRKFPQTLMRDIRDRHGKIRLIVGEGVGGDAGFNTDNETDAQKHRKKEIEAMYPVGDPMRLTWQWSHTPGSGGSIAGSRASHNPTRIAINHLYDRHGSTNLFLHEHAHTLDTFNGPNSISSSFLWTRAATSDRANVTRLMNAINPAVSDGDSRNGQEESYMQRFRGEGFAELFAYYHGCPESRRQMEEVAPTLADFFSGLTSIEAFERRSREGSIITYYVFPR